MSDKPRLTPEQRRALTQEGYRKMEEKTRTKGPEPSERAKEYGAVRSPDPDYAPATGIPVPPASRLARVRGGQPADKYGGRRVIPAAKRPRPSFPTKDVNPAVSEGNDPRGTVRPPTKSSGGAPAGAAPQPQSDYDPSGRQANIDRVKANRAAKNAPYDQAKDPDCNCTGPDCSCG